MELSAGDMEREGFKRCMENIYEKRGKIMVVATDRHVGIRADMKRNFPEVDHQRRKNVLISLSGSDPSQTTFGGVPKDVEETRRC